MRSRLALECVASLLPGVDEHSGEHHRADRTSAKLETCDDAEVATTAAQSPEQVGMLVRCGVDERPVGEDDVRRQQRVDREAVATHEPSDAAAERETADPGVGHLAGRHGEPVLLRPGIELAEESASADAHGSALGVDLDRPQRPQVDAQGAVTDRASRDRVPAPADREGHPGAPGSTMAAATSSASLTKATAAGRRSIAPFQHARATS